MRRTLLEEQIKNTDSVLPIPLAKAALPNALLIDLRNNSTELVPIEQTFLNKYVGGPALAARLWAYYSNDFEEPIVITGDYSATLITVAFKSPATGKLMFNSIPGKFSMEFGAVVIVGSLEKPGVVRLNELPDGDCPITIGEAAANHIVYASAVCNGTLTGRGGFGYAMAQRNLTSISIGILPVVKKNFDNSVFIRNARILGWAPIDNFSKRTDPRLFHLCAAERTRKLGDVFIPYDAVLMLGSNTGCYDIKAVSERYQICLDAGLDPISTGNILGWIRDVQERGILVLPNPVDFKDNSQVLLLLKSIIKRDKGYESFGDGLKDTAHAMQINGLECGPFDYRGTQASALNDSLENWFPVYFDLIPGLNIKDKANITMYNEELVMGLQCLNKDPELYIPKLIDELGPIKKLLINKNIVSFDRLINIDELNITDVFTAGQNCRALVREINSCLDNVQHYIPDYFCIDPESNAKDKVIVDIKFLMNRYRMSLQTQAE